MNLAERSAAALAELRAVLAATDPGAFEAAAAAIAGAGRIVLYGCGREGLQMRGLAMRLYHLGLDAHYQGEMTTPPIGAGDLFVASAGPGTLSTVDALVQTARAAGADVLFLTAMAEAPAATRATHVLTVPAQTMATDAAATSSLPMGSLYEGALFVLFEVLVLELAERLGARPDAMRARHTNLE